MAGGDKEFRVSLQMLRVLRAFLADPATQISGADVLRFSAVASGTAYPILLRLETAGWLSSRWENVDPASACQPRKRLYRLTANGLAQASGFFAGFDPGWGVAP
jgi:PadR family transcriptional regulator, regulatory protein PadR